jgi:ribosome recycling factor
MTSRVDKSVEFMKNEFGLLRAGRANAKVLEKVTVNYYGTLTPLTQMANISTPEPRVLVVNVWDKGAMKDVEKAILASNIGVTPNNDGTVIRLIFPELNEERRKELVKQVKKLAEDCKVVSRNIRREVIEQCKKLKNDKEISEDDLAMYEKEADSRTAKTVELVEKLAKDKETDIMSV